MRNYTIGVVYAVCAFQFPHNTVHCHFTSQLSLTSLHLHLPSSIVRRESLSWGNQKSSLCGTGNLSPVRRIELCVMSEYKLVTTNLFFLWNWGAANNKNLNLTGKEREDFYDFTMMREVEECEENKLAKKRHELWRKHQEKNSYLKRWEGREEKRWWKKL